MPEISDLPEFIPIQTVFDSNYIEDNLQVIILRTWASAAGAVTPPGFSYMVQI